jgi:hypothetical protein
MGTGTDQPAIISNTWAGQASARGSGFIGAGLFIFTVQIMNPLPQAFDFQGVFIAQPPRFADGVDRLGQFVQYVLGSLAPFIGADLFHFSHLGNILFEDIKRGVQIGYKFPMSPEKRFFYVFLLCHLFFSCLFFLSSLQVSDMNHTGKICDIRYSALGFATNVPE